MTRKKVATKSTKSTYPRKVLVGRDPKTNQSRFLYRVADNGWWWVGLGYDSLEGSGKGWKMSHFPAITVQDWQMDFSPEALPEDRAFLQLWKLLQEK